MNAVWLWIICRLLMILVCVSVLLNGRFSPAHAEYRILIASNLVSIQSLIAALNDDDGYRWNYTAQQKLIGLGDQAIPMLVKTLRDPSASPHLRAGAANTLGMMGNKAETAVPALLAEFYRDDEIGAEVDNALIATGSATAVLGLKQALRHHQAIFRQRAAHVLGSLADLSRSAVPDLILAFKDDQDNDGSVRVAVANALGEIAPGDKRVIDALITVFVDDNAPSLAVDVVASVVLSKGGKPILPKLRQALRSNGGNPRVAWAIAHIIGTMGSEAAEAIPELIAIASGQPVSDGGAVAPDQQFADPFGIGRPVRERAIEALGEIGRDAVNAIAVVVQVLIDTQERDDIRIAAAYALAEVSLGATDDLPKAIFSERAALLASAIEVLRRDKVKLAKRPGFDREVLQPVEDIASRLATLRIGIAMSGVASILSILLALALSGRLRRTLLTYLGRRWSLVAGQCEHLVDVAASQDTIVVTARSPYFPEARVTRLELPFRFRWPPKSAVLAPIQTRFRSRENILIIADDPLFKRPWALEIGQKWSLADKAIIAGQVCAVGGASAHVARSSRKLTAAVLKCARPARGIPPLRFADAEAKTVQKRFRAWGASIVTSGPEVEATASDFLRALSLADFVHLSAHADDSAFEFADRAVRVQDIRGLPTKELRCRLLVLAVCNAADIRNIDRSLVYQLVRNGVNVLAARERIDDRICQVFFEEFYRALLPGRSASGIQLADAIRIAATVCRDRFTADANADTIGKLILYGDPSIELRLQAPKHS